MATLAASPRVIARDDRFFLVSAIVMALVIVAGFSTHLAMGRSSFSAPPVVHAHAVVFMGWVGIYVLQTVFATTGSIVLHRRLGWIGAGWIVAMVALGIGITVMNVRRGHAPFFFEPLYFLVMNPLSILTFAGLTVAAIVRRHQTAWHRRLHFCGMAILLGPGFGRLLPMPLLIPYAGYAPFVALMLFPLAGMIADQRRTGSVHPAWWWGAGTIVVMQALIVAITYSPLGLALYDAVVAGAPGATIAPLDFPPPPGGPLITGR